MGSSSPQRKQQLDDGRMSPFFSIVQGGFSLTDNDKQIVRSIINKMAMYLVHCLTIIVTIRVTSAISIAAISSIAATSGNVVALVNSTHPSRA